jgi:CDP-diacylglycerol--serine O-phosphatidyltransferase
MFLFNKNHHYNIANIVTYLNIVMGVLAIYFIVQENFFVAIILAWIGGACDIIDGKLARKYNLSTDFGIQIDSFADFLSFVIMPTFLLFFALKVYLNISGIDEIILAISFIWYIISALIRLISFNLKVDAGEVSKYFEGIPTPLGAIFLWVLYLLSAYGVVTNEYIFVILVLSIAYLLNSKIKIPHP